MQYIILDLEWNQPWPGSPSAQKVLPVSIHGEIIQIGAVRMLEDQTITDEFQVLVRPRYYRRLNKRVSSLTGIKESRLKAEGIGFAEAMQKFRAWCGEDCTFLTWGFDDLTIMQENLTLFGFETDWITRWFNAQMIFNAQTDGSNAQKALKTAMELCGIQPTRPAHDALGDAFHTAQVCATLDLMRGCLEYEKALKLHENGFHGAQPEGCLDRRVFHGYPDKDKAIGDMGGRENRCPECGKTMKSSRWYPQPGRRYMSMATCPEHGKYLIRIRLSEDADGTLKVSRLTYEGASEAAKAYEKLAQKPRRHHRRNSRKASVKQPDGAKKDVQSTSANN